LPKGRALGRRWLLEAYQLLVENGVAYLVGANAVFNPLSKTQKTCSNESHHSAYKKGTAWLGF
jgi:hypothetical protein